MKKRIGDRGKRRNGEGGFTLLEIMIALAIIGIALTVLIHTVNYHTNVMYENTLTTRMYQMAKEKMYELETDRHNSEGDIGATGFEYENTAYRREDSGIVELRTVVKGRGRQVMLNELVVGKTESKR